MPDAIAQWLTDQDYEKGQSLYDSLGDDSFLKYLFSTGDTPYNRIRLEEELRKIKIQLDALNISAAPYTIPGKGKKTNQKFVDTYSKDEYAGLPEEVQSLNEQKRVEHTEMSNLHSRLEDMKTNEDRRKAGVRIKHLEKSLKEIWEKLDYYAEHKKLPEAEKPVMKEMTFAQAFTRRNTLRSYISKFPDSPKLKAWKDERAHCEEIMEEKK